MRREERFTVSSSLFLLLASIYFKKSGIMSKISLVCGRNTMLNPIKTSLVFTPSLKERIKNITHRISEINLFANKFCRTFQVISYALA